MENNCSDNEERTNFIRNCDIDCLMDDIHNLVENENDIEKNVDFLLQYCEESDTLESLRTFVRTLFVRVND